MGPGLAGNPAVSCLRDRRLCVPALRRVCLCLQVRGHGAFPGVAATIQNCVQPTRSTSRRSTCCKVRYATPITKGKSYVAGRMHHEPRRPVWSLRDRSPADRDARVAFIHQQLSVIELQTQAHASCRARIVHDPGHNDRSVCIRAHAFALDYTQVAFHPLQRRVVLSRQCGFFGTPLDLGLATATTSAAFFPHCEPLSRDARASSVIDQPN